MGGEAVDVLGILRRKREEQEQSYDSFNQGAAAAYADAIRLLEAHPVGLLTAAGLIPFSPDEYSSLRLAVSDAGAYSAEHGLPHRVAATRELLAQFPTLADVFSP